MMPHSIDNLSFCEDGPKIRRRKNIGRVEILQRPIDLLKIPAERICWSKDGIPRETDVEETNITPQT